MNERYRILVVLPLYGGSLPIGRYCARALQQLGHMVEIFEAPDFYGSFTALKTLRVGSDRLDYLENSFLQVVSQAILAKVEFFAPDLVLALAQAPLSLQALKRLRRQGVPTAMWFVEDYEVFTYWQTFAPYYDLFAIIQKGAFPEKLAAIGQKNSLYLPLAADLSVHKPLTLSPQERKEFGSELSFVGAGYPNRRLAFRSLARYDFRLWGNDWDGESVLASCIQRQGQRIDTEEVVKIFNATTININLHSSVRPHVLVGDGDFVNPRTFELAACGAFQLVDQRALLGELFAEHELATFSTMEELLQAVDWYLAHPQERARLIQNSRQRVQEEHTYEHRMRSLLDQARPLISKSAGTSSSWLGDLPEDLQTDLQSLLTRLGLSTQVSFEDLVWAVRSQEGPLEPLETMILFLDEWKKQYGI